MIFLGFFLSIIIVISLIALTIVLYFLVDRKLKKFGFKNLNIIFIVFVFIITLSIHFACIFNAQENTANVGLWEAFTLGLKEIYGSLGGITFEGQSDEVKATLLSSFYFGSIIWLAGTNALLIGIGVSYEFRCKLVFFINKLWPYWCNKRPIYIFTSITDDALTLAKSIRDDKKLPLEYKINGLNNKSKDYRPIIIFAGDEIEPFDKNNRLHQEIKMSNYFYFSFGKKTKLKKRGNNVVPTRYDLLYRLFFLKTLGSSMLYRFISNKDIYVIALDKGMDGKALESKNTDAIFDDIESIAPVLLKAFYKKYKNVKEKYEKQLEEDLKKVPESNFEYKATRKKIEKDYMEHFFPRINYYALSNQDINFEFIYKNLIERTKLQHDYLKEEQSKWLSEKLGNRHLKHQIINLLLDESEYTLFRNIFGITILNEAILSGEDLVLKYTEKPVENILTKEEYVEDKEHRVLVIGFGKNGQAALGHLYSTVIDGAFRKEDDKFIPNKFYADVIDADIDRIIGSFIERYPSFVIKKGCMDDGIVKPNEEPYHNLKKRYGYDDNKFKDVIKYMAFPHIYYQKQNYNSEEFLITKNKIMNHYYDSIIIALGDDERNIECANSILQSIRQDINVNNTIKFKTTRFYINLRDVDNNNRICWENREEYYIIKNIYVDLFGNATDIFSSRLLKITGAINIDKAYNSIDNDEPIPDNKEGKCYSYNKFYKLSLYEKKTNAAGSLFGRFYYDYIIGHNLKPILDKDKENYERIVNETREKGHSQIIINGLTFDVKKAMNKEKEEKFAFIIQGYDDVIKKIYDSIKVGYDRFDKWNEENGAMALPMTFANYYRLMSTFDEKYRNGPCKTWYYLSQFDHIRWCRHMMMYGRAYTELFEPIFMGENDKIVAKAKVDEKYWKNIYKLSDCLLPYSRFPNYLTDESVTADYLVYGKEDYDYGIILALYSINDKK